MAAVLCGGLVRSRPGRTVACVGVWRSATRSFEPRGSASPEVLLLSQRCRSEAATRFKPVLSLYEPNSNPDQERSPEPTGFSSLT